MGKTDLRRLHEGPLPMPRSERRSAAPAPPPTSSPASLSLEEKKPARPPRATARTKASSKSDDVAGEVGILELLVSHGQEAPRTDRGWRGTVENAANATLASLALGSALVACSASPGRAAPVLALVPPPSLDAGLLGVEQMRADLAFEREKILAQHSHPFLYEREDELDRLYDELEHELDRPLGKLEFYRRAARLAASLKDGHTLVDPLIDDFLAFSKTRGVFPLQVSFVGDRLFVRKNDSGDSHLAPGTEIRAINGVSVPALVVELRGLINDVRPLYDIYARLFRELFWLRYGPAESFAVAYRDEHGVAGSSVVSAHVFPESAFQSYQPEGLAHAFDILSPSKVGLLTLNSFSPSDDFSAFLDRSFATLAEHHTTALIIDVRKNGGGSGRLAQETVSYLTDHPYKQIGAFYVKVTDDLKALYQRGTTHTDEDTRRIVMGNPAGALVDGLKDSGPVVVTPAHRDHVFHGKVYLLTANNTFSAAAMFAAYVKCNALGKVVGEEPGQATNFVADAVPFTMPHSGLTFTVSFSEIHLPCEQSYFDGIRPDYPVTASPGGLAAGVDETLARAVALASGRD